MPKTFFNDGSQSITPPTLTASELSSEVVLRSGKYFECDKEFTDMNGLKFTVTEAEADAVLPQFTGADLNVEHAPSVFDGLLGRMNRLWRDGKTIYAEYAIPKLLHTHMGGKELKVSSEWDSVTKMPLGAALVLNPAVKDAVMMAAFSDGKAPAEAVLREKLYMAMTRHNTPEGQIAMQDLHDAAARAGGVCDRQNVQMASAHGVAMASAHEATAVQKIHDIAADHGATCKSGDKPAYYSQKEKPMTAWEKIVAHFKKSGMSEAEAEEILAADPAKFSAPAGMTDAEKAQFSTLLADSAALKAENQRMKAASVLSEAEAFALAQVQAGRLLPYEKPGIVAQFCRAAEDDAAAPVTVKFAALEAGKPVEKTGGRLDALKASVTIRPSHGLTQEMTGHGRQVGENDFRALFTQSGGSETADEKQAKLDKAADAELAKTETGRKVLASRASK